MPWNRRSPVRSLALQPSDVGRREMLVVSAVAVSGCSAVGNIVGEEYDKSDLELTLALECVSDERDDVIATLSWEWASGDGGSPPLDAVVIDWPDEKWELLRANHSTTETVRFDGVGVADGVQNVWFEHDDAAADGGTTYAASCKLSPNGDFEAAERNVFGRFFHVREESDGGSGDGRFEHLDVEWKAVRETDQRSSCGEEA